MERRARLQLIKRWGAVSDVNGWIGWAADRMANRSAVALPGVPGLHNERTDERAVLFGQIHASEGHVSAIEQIKSRGGHQLIKNMGVVTGVDGRVGWTADRMAHLPAGRLP